VLVPRNKYVLGSESTSLEQIYDYTTVYKRLSSYPSGYYILWFYIHNSESGVSWENRGNIGLETGKQGTGIRGKKSGEKNRGLETGETGKQGTGNRGKTGDWNQGENRGLETGGKQGTGIRGKRSGEQGTGNRRLELGERNQGTGIGGKQGTGIRGKKSGEQGTGCIRLAIVRY